MAGFAFIESSLTTLIQNIKKFEWLEACERRLKILKDRFTSSSVLTAPEGTNGLILYCDAF